MTSKAAGVGVWMLSLALGAAVPAQAQQSVSPEASANGGVKAKSSRDRGGLKRLAFGAQEVEGRIRSPQILYFLRRVRAQFGPRPLGHRSFLRELKNTRNHGALR